MRELQKKLVSPPIVALPNVRGKDTLDIYTCNVQVRFVRIQEQPDGTTKLVGYWSRSVPAVEQAYNTIKRKCCATVWPVLIPRPYLVGTCFTIRTEHDSLKRNLNLADATNCLARWQLRLIKFGFDVVHRDDIKRQAADAFFRLTATGEDRIPIEDNLPVAVLDAAPESNSKVCLVTDMTTISDEADTRTSAHIVEDNNVEKGEAAPTLQEFFAASCHKRLLQASRKQCWPGKYRVHRW